MKTILCLAAAIFFAALGVVSLALIFGWFGVIQILNKAFPVLPIRWAYAITFELIAIFAIHALLLMPDRGAKKGNGRPILLVHGYLHHAKVWGLQKKWLEALGAGPIYTINLGPPFQSIRTYAEKVSQKAQAIAQETGRNDLILIGHSMGGIISLMVAREHPGELLVRRQNGPGQHASPSHYPWLTLSWDSCCAHWPRSECA